MWWWKKFIYLFFILFLKKTIAESDGILNLIPNNPCTVYNNISGTINETVTNTSYCWMLFPIMGGLTMQPKMINLNFSYFHFTRNLIFVVYRTIIPDKFSLVYTFSNTSVPPRSMITLHTHTIFMSASGSGMGSFLLNWDTPNELESVNSLNTFVGLIIVLSIPGLFGCLTLLPFCSNAEKTKKDRCTLILFLIAFFFGFLFCFLIIGRKIALQQP